MLTVKKAAHRSTPALVFASMVVLAACGDNSRNDGSKCGGFEGPKDASYGRVCAEDQMCIDDTCTARCEPEACPWACVEYEDTGFMYCKIPPSGGDSSNNVVNGQ